MPDLLDLAKGYWQVPMNPEDRDKTAFVSPKGLYQFTTMLFGLSGAPATFAGVYLDDIIIHSDTWEDHLDEALKRLKDAGLTLKLKKCTFATEDCTYLGYRIGRGGVKPENRKVQVVAEMSRPTTKKDVRTSLGMAGYYRRFVKDYATIAEPLTELTRKNLPERVEWNNKAELAFQKLKWMLITAPLMKNPDFNRNFILQTDASWCRSCFKPRGRRRPTNCIF